MKNLTKDIKELLLENRMAQLGIVLFAVITVWWLLVKPLDPSLFVAQKHSWSATYELLSIFGGIFGVVISNYWGGYKSIFGRAILAFSLGLFLQSFGQTVYNYYTLFAKIEAPYPSLGDIGYFGSIPAYIYGVVLLGRASSLRISFKSFHNRMLSILVPLLMLVSSYFIFLKDYQFDGTNFLTVFLDFGYPLGQAGYVSIALLVLWASRKFLGGIMKRPITLILLALVVQYVCDFNFLYSANHDLWYAGGLGDYLYAVSYFIMTLAIIYIGHTFNAIKKA